MNKEKNLLISFSGGLDSTYLVYSNLKKGHYVTGLYTTIENNRNKVQVEKHQIEKITELFNQEFPGKFTLHYGIAIDVPYSGDILFKQIVIWLISLLYHNPRYDEVQIGAVMNDDMLSYLDEIKKIWGSFAFLNEKHPPLTFPLTKISKLHIAEALPRNYKDLVVYCENPTIIEPITNKNKELKFENCNHCHSCKRYKFDSDYLGIDYGQINHKNWGEVQDIPDEPIDDLYEKYNDKAKRVDIILGIKQSKGTMKNKITIQKSKRSSLPMPMTGSTMDIPGFIDTSKRKRPIKKKSSEIRRLKKR